MKNICILGADPGVSGALAFYFPTTPDRVSAVDAPVVDGRLNCAELAERIRIMRPDVAIIEKVGAMPKQGVASTFKFGVSFGSLVGVVAAMKVPTHFVTPTKWKKHFGLSADKEESRRRAIELWPACAENFSRKKDHGRAEAALLALYGAERIIYRGSAD